MTVGVIVPVKPLIRSKSRLRKELNKEHRNRMTLQMLQDVISTITSTSGIDECVVVSNDKNILKRIRSFNVIPLIEDRVEGVNVAVQKGNEYFLERGFSSTIVIPADLPLLKPNDLRLLIRTGSTTRCVVIAPSRKFDGTNALFRNPPNVIGTRFDHDSFRSHCIEAKRGNVKLRINFTHGFMMDVDTPGDLKEVLRFQRSNKKYFFLQQKVIPGKIE